MQGHALISDYLSYQQSLCIVMIRKNLLFCKIIRIKTSSKSLFDSYMERFKPERETCPICSSTGNCHIHHYYGRSIIDFKAGRQEKSDLCVLRVFCDSCRHAHDISKTLYIVCLFYKFHLFFRKSRFFSDILATLNCARQKAFCGAWIIYDPQKIRVFYVI